MAQRVPQVKEKIFNDPVHGTMIFGPKLVEVIDTPQFQRLRNIKQLGTVYHVYPGATHSRFEHSLGTAHLAGKFIRMLRVNQPELGVTDDDVLCVEMAGLCHDLGHGPFSHMFDQLFLPAVGVKWQHEKGSCDMFSHLLKENNIKLSQDTKKHEKLERSVKMMIKPPKDVKDIPEKKRFLYEFISNERNKVDVDKWDYFARDCHHLGFRNSFDYERFMILCRVISLEIENGVTTICSHEKESKNLYEMFHVRAALHKRAYQHRISTAVNIMLCDALVKANEHILIGNSKMSEVVDNMEDFTHFDDNIIDRIMQSTTPCLQEAQKILKRIKVRKFYKYVGSTKLSNEKHTKLQERHKDDIDLGIAGEIWALKGKSLNGEKEEIIGVNVAKFDYGMKRDNPCESFYFYTKENPDKASQISRDDVSEMLPEVFVEYEIQVFCKTEDEESHSIIKNAFDEWQTNLLA